MPRDASGNYSPPSVYLATPGTTIRAEQHNVPIQDMSQALTDSLPRNGSAPMTGPLQMGGRRVLNTGNPTATTDAANKRYVDDAVTNNATVTPARVTMDGAGLVGSETAASGPSRRIFIGTGLEFNNGSLRTRLGDGLSILAGAIVAAVSRFATGDEARAGSNNTAAMTPLNTLQFANANLLGMQQAWTNQTGNRSPNTTYTNTTGKPIKAAVRAQSGSLQVAVAGSGNWITVGAWENNADGRQFQYATVPAGHVYRAQVSSILEWSELR